MIKNASAEGADFIFFPEIQLSPFFPQYEKANAKEYLIDLNHEYIQRICETCKE